MASDSVCISQQEDPHFVSFASLYDHWLSKDTTHSIHLLNLIYKYPPAVIARTGLDVRYNQEL